MSDLLGVDSDTVPYDRFVPPRFSKSLKTDVGVEDLLQPPVAAFDGEFSNESVSVGSSSLCGSRLGDSSSLTTLSSLSVPSDLYSTEGSVDAASQSCDRLASPERVPQSSEVAFPCAPTVSAPRMVPAVDSIRSLMEKYRRSPSSSSSASHSSPRSSSLWSPSVSTAAVAPASQAETSVAPLSPEDTSVAPLSPEDTSVSPLSPGEASVASLDPQNPSADSLSLVKITISPLSPDETSISPLSPDETTVSTSSLEEAPEAMIQPPNPPKSVFSQTDAAPSFPQPVSSDGRACPSLVRSVASPLLSSDESVYREDSEVPTVPEAVPTSSTLTTSTTPSTPSSPASARPSSPFPAPSLPTGSPLVQTHEPSLSSHTHTSSHGSPALPIAPAGCLPPGTDSAVSRAVPTWNATLLYPFPSDHRPLHTYIPRKVLCCTEVSQLLSASEDTASSASVSVPANEFRFSHFNLLPTEADARAVSALSQSIDQVLNLSSSSMRSVFSSVSRRSQSSVPSSPSPSLGHHSSSTNQSDGINHLAIEKRTLSETFPVGGDERHSPFQREDSRRSSAGMESRIGSSQSSSPRTGSHSLPSDLTRSSSDDDSSLCQPDFSARASRDVSERSQRRLSPESQNGPSTRSLRHSGRSSLSDPLFSDSLLSSSDQTTTVSHPSSEGPCSPLAAFHRSPPENTRRSHLPVLHSSRSLTPQNAGIDPSNQQPAAPAHQFSAPHTRPTASCGPLPLHASRRFPPGLSNPPTQRTRTSRSTGAHSISASLGSSLPPSEGLTRPASPSPPPTETSQRLVSPPFFSSSSHRSTETPSQNDTISSSVPSRHCAEADSPDASYSPNPPSSRHSLKRSVPNATYSESLSSSSPSRRSAEAPSEKDAFSSSVPSRHSPEQNLPHASSPSSSPAFHPSSSSDSHDGAAASFASSLLPHRHLLTLCLQDVHSLPSLATSLPELFTAITLQCHQISDRFFGQLFLLCRHRSALFTQFYGRSLRVPLTGLFHDCVHYNRPSPALARDDHSPIDPLSDLILPLTVHGKSSLARLALSDWPILWDGVVVGVLQLFSLEEELLMRGLTAVDQMVLAELCQSIAITFGHLREHRRECVRERSPAASQRHDGHRSDAAECP